MKSIFLRLMKILVLISVVCYRCLVVPSKQTLRSPISSAYLRTFVVILLIQLLHIFFEYFETTDQLRIFSCIQLFTKLLL